MCFSFIKANLYPVEADVEATSDDSAKVNNAGSLRRNLHHPEKKTMSPRIPTAEPGSHARVLRTPTIAWFCSAS